MSQENDKRFLRNIISKDASILSLTLEFKNPGIGNVGALWSLKTSEKFLFGYFRAQTWHNFLPPQAPGDFAAHTRRIA